MAGSGPTRLTAVVPSLVARGGDEDLHDDMARHRWRERKVAINIIAEGSKSIPFKRRGRN